MGKPAGDIIGLALRMKRGSATVNGYLVEHKAGTEDDTKAGPGGLPPGCKLEKGALQLRPNSMVLAVGDAAFAIHPVWPAEPKGNGLQYAEVDSKGGYVCLTDTSLDEKGNPNPKGNPPISYLIPSSTSSLFELMVNEGGVKIGWDLLST